VVTKLKHRGRDGVRIAIAPLAVGGGALLLAALLVSSRTGFVAVAMIAYVLAAAVVAVRFPADAPRGRFGAANAVTLLRAVVACLFAALLFEPEPAPAVAWAAVAVAAAAMLLDGVDGWAARRTGTASAFGARFDMETDAAFVLILSVLVAAWDRVGWWVVAIGAMRYAFVAAAWAEPRLSGALPPSFRRKMICVWQVVTLIVLLAPVAWPDWLATGGAAVALALLAWSFAVDVAFLLRPPGARP
jgi:phosphatidylglycerophosphate synthase